MTVYTKDRIRNRIKAVAASRGQSMSEFVIEVMEKRLDRLDKDGKDKTSVSRAWFGDRAEEV